MTHEKPWRFVPAALTGLTDGMCVETEDGWRQVSALRTGMRVHAFDGGLRPVRRIERLTFGADLPGLFPEGLILVPGGALGNCQDFYLLPAAHVLLSGGAVAAITGDVAALVQAEDLAGHGGICRAMPVDGIESVRIEFDDEEVIWANTGVLVHCPVSGEERPVSRMFPVLDAEAARVLLTCHFLELEVAPGAGAPRRNGKGAAR